MSAEHKPHLELAETVRAFIDKHGYVDVYPPTGERIPYSDEDSAALAALNSLVEQLEAAELRDKMRDDGEHALLGEVEARDAQIAELERMNARLISQNRRLLEASEEGTTAASDGTDSGTPDDGSTERLSRPATPSSEASSPASEPESA